MEESSSAAPILVIVIIIAVIVLSFAAIIGMGVLIATGHNRRQRRLAAQPVAVNHGQQGQIVEIPVAQISRVAPGAPFGAFARNNGFGFFRIHPDRVEYRLLRSTSVPFNQILQVDAPYAAQPFFTVQVHGDALAVGVLAGSEQAVRHALWLLAYSCPLSERARARIS